MLSQAPLTPGRIRRQLAGAEQSVILGGAAVLVSDYGGGMAREPSVRAVLGEATARIPVVWDVHSHGAQPVSGVRLVTPNAREAAYLARDIGLDITGDGLGGDIDRGRALLHAWSAASVVVTRGSEGAVLLDGLHALPIVVPAVVAPHADSCGAGDCFAVAAAGLLAEGALVSEAVIGAVSASSRFVAEGGVTAVTSQAPQDRAPASADTAAEVVARVRAGGGTVVATAGCFDLLHMGHVTMLERARALGDCLIVCLNDDGSVRRLKGKDRPVIPAHDRAAVLSALASVNGVVEFSEDNPDEVLRQIQPDVYVKGGDYGAADVPESGLVASWGGRTVILPYVVGASTTRTIDKIINRGSPAGHAG
jgi:rfaE bifunctional protein nucleotidyltransferase chain/domain